MIEEKVVQYKFSIQSLLNRNNTRGASEYRRIFSKALGRMEKKQLSAIKSNRCFVAKGGKKIKHCSLRNISNVSDEGYC